MKKRSFLIVILTIVLLLSVSITGCKTGDVGFVGNKSNYSQNPSMSNGLATSANSLDKTPIQKEELVREDDSESILTKNRKSVVEIYVTTTTGSGGASGVFVNYVPYATPTQSGAVGIAYVLTCHHVIEDVTYANVRDFYGNLFPAGLIGSNPSGDTALLWVEVNYVPQVAKIASSSKLQVGETVYAIGNPLGTLGGTVTKGVVSALSRELLVGNQYEEVLQLDAAINKGSSGGGLFTEDGYLIGMTNSGYEGRDGLGFAVPSDNFLSDINNFITTYQDDLYNSYGYIPNKASIGVGLNQTLNGIVYVASLTDVGSWKNSGVLLEDVLVSVTINGETQNVVTGAETLKFINSKNLNVGDTYVLTVQRIVDNAYQQMDITITVRQLIYTPPVIQTEQSQPLTENVSTLEPVGLATFAFDTDELLAKKMYIGQFCTIIDREPIVCYGLVREDDSNSPLTQNRKSVVEIYTTTSTTSGGAGSGVIVKFMPFTDKVGGVAYIVTNHHVVEGAYYVNVKDMFSDKLYSAGLIGSNKYSDIAVLYAELDYTPSVATFADSDKLQVGNEIYAIGNPLGILGGSVSKGIVSSLNRVSIRDGYAIELMQVDSALNHGSSGGGIFTEEGYLVAIANSGYDSYDGLGFAIPGNYALKVINELIATYKDDVYNSYGYVKGAVNLGISVENYGNYIWNSGENQGKKVVYISKLDTSCVCYKNGLKVGDCIYSITYKNKNIAIEDASNLLIELYNANLTAGEQITFVVDRNNEKVTITFTLEQYIYSPPSMNV